jgi:hypothetical protein
MSVAEKLIDGAIADVDVLRALKEQDDNFGLFRDVDFLLRAPSREKAELVVGFINDYQYGTATPVENDGSHSVRVIINMPVTQNVILSVSGFMTCIAALYGLDFDGLGCTAQTNT